MVPKLTKLRSQIRLERIESKKLKAFERGPVIDYDKSLRNGY